MTLIDLAPLALTAFGGSAATIVVQFLRGKSEQRAAETTVSAQLEQHWATTTLELVDALREELSEARREIAALRPMESRLAHLEEALDHIHALLSSRTAAEKRAAERRARLFLGRMRIAEPAIAAAAGD